MFVENLIRSLLMSYSCSFLKRLNVSGHVIFARALRQVKGGFRLGSDKTTKLENMAQNMNLSLEINNDKKEFVEFQVSILSTPDGKFFVQVGRIFQHKRNKGS